MSSQELIDKIGDAVEGYRQAAGVKQNLSKERMFAHAKGRHFLEESQSLIVRLASLLNIPSNCWTTYPLLFRETESELRRQIETHARDVRVAERHRLASIYPYRYVVRIKHGSGPFIQFAQANGGVWWIRDNEQLEIFGDLTFATLFKLTFGLRMVRHRLRSNNS